MDRIEYVSGIVGALFALSACGSSDAATGTPGTGSGGAAGGAGFSNGGAAGAGGNAGAGAGGNAGAGAGGSAGAAGAAGPFVVQGGPPCAPRGAPYMDQIASAVPFYQGGFGDSPQELALRGDTLYFTMGQGVMKLPLGQSNPTLVTAVANVSRSLGLVFNDTHVFFDEGPAFKRGALDGSTPTPETVLDGVTLSNEYAVAADAQNLYFFDGNGNLSAVPVGGGTPKTLASGVTGSSVALSSGYLYFARSGATSDEVARVSVAGGAAESVASFGQVNVVATDGTTLYAGGDSGISAARVDGSSAPLSLMGSPSSFSFGMDQLVLGGSRLFWASTGTFGWVARDGTACEAVVDEITGFQGFAGTDTDAYVGDNDRIMRIPLQ